MENSDVIETPSTTSAPQHDRRMLCFGFLILGTIIGTIIGAWLWTKFWATTSDCWPRYTLVLKSSYNEGQQHASRFLSQAFSLKDASCAAITSTLPIALLVDLTPEQAAVCHVLFAGIQHKDVILEYQPDLGNLPKVDWPQTPLLFKRDLNQWVADYKNISIPCNSFGTTHSLLDTLVNRLASTHTP